MTMAILLVLAFLLHFLVRGFLDFVLNFSVPIDVSILSNLIFLVSNPLSYITAALHIPVPSFFEVIFGVFWLFVLLLLVTRYIGRKRAQDPSGTFRTARRFMWLPFFALFPFNLAMVLSAFAFFNLASALMLISFLVGALLFLFAKNTTAATIGILLWVIPVTIFSAEEAWDIFSATIYFMFN